MDLKNFFQSKAFKWLIGAVGALIVCLLVLQLGMFIGFRKANFSYRWGENYHRAFGGPREGFLPDFAGKDFIGGHGAAGTIAKIEGDTLIVQSKEQAEKIVKIATSTLIQMGRTEIAPTELKMDESVVVIGSPQDDGSINAKIIRVFNPNDLPPPPPPGPARFKFWR
ncbi:hypothetical protein COU00_01045 [Candidatus Falkowbacteria bacterium CG10_big_fil_rev_8_21_14_0_10_43_11]|uniref:DUF5666 domain-containing protein n=1 Tax=Candidatus Falkowbacteria bacterium CG10_big_fil_rev_8_21_14_0_10_43_11 TaxID=1974568 RepID=A0A2M6WMQ1_9BACT|nr:MAG: hypothetical protein COU00_01045 [Candidatus Falkowbacteria bacterium CG10_big_fil_rev_8_21_14_0_10_43_11]